MLLYVTIEEILGEPERRDSRPAQDFPSATTLGGLYDQAMRKIATRSPGSSFSRSRM